MTPGRALLLSKVTEKQWQAQVEAWAKRGGFRTYHTLHSFGSAKGFPDLVCVKDGRVLFIELKTMTGRLSDDQSAWATDLSACPGVDYYCWRPSDEDVVRAVLLGGTRMA